MAWCKLEDTFREHRKPKRLARVLGIRRAEARGLIASLWSWCVTNAPDGKLNDLVDFEIEEAADWEGLAGAFVSAAIDVEIIGGPAGDREVIGFLERAESFRKVRKTAEKREQERLNRESRVENMCESVEHNGGTDANLCNTKPAERRGEEKRGDPDLAPAPNLSAASVTEDGPRSSLSLDAKNEDALTASPSAPAVPEKKKRRSPEQQERSKANNRLYRELYEAAEGHPPTGLDQAFNGMMARFSDRHADNAEHILRWVFTSCPDKSFRDKGWPLELIIQQAPRLWRELNNPRAAVENLAAPRRQHQLAIAANNEVEFEKFLAQNGEAPAYAR